MIVRRTSFIEPCQPSKVARPPSGPSWFHEIKHDGYRLMVRRDGSRVRCFTRDGHACADRFPSIVEYAVQHLKAQSFLIDGQAAIGSVAAAAEYCICHPLYPTRQGAKKTAPMRKHTIMPSTPLHREQSGKRHRHLTPAE